MEDESSSVILAPAELAAPRYAIRGFASTHLGLRHELNEDSYALERTGTGGALVVVCDGMGGMGRGEQASQLALGRLTEALARGHAHPLDAATSAIHQVDRELVSAFDLDGSGKRPGTTCAIVHVEGGIAYISWVGDSSVLILRDGRIAARTRPHRVVQDLIDSGAMTWEEARVSPMARYLARSLGGRSPDEPVVEPSMLRPWRLVAGDVILVCSDGLTDFVRPEEIVEIVAAHEGEEEAVRALVALALERGVDDNVTIGIVRCVDASGADDDARARFIAPAWEHIPDPEGDDQEEPDYHSDIRQGSPPPEPPTAAPVNPLVVAGVVFGAGAVLMMLAFGAWIALS